MIAVFGWVGMAWLFVCCVAYLAAPDDYLAFRSFNWPYFFTVLAVSLVMIVVG